MRGSTAGDGPTLPPPARCPPRLRARVATEREREGPRLRVATVRIVRRAHRQPAAWSGSSCPAPLTPSRGGTCRPPPLGMGTKKYGMKLTRGGMPSSSLKPPATESVPASLGGKTNLAPLGPSAALVPLGGAVPGRPRASLARALVTWGRGQDPVRARPQATKWGVGRAAGGLREAPWA